MNESFQTVEKMLKAIVRRLSVNSVIRYRDYGRPSFNEPKDPRVCYLINDVNGRHPHFRRFRENFMVFYSHFIYQNHYVFAQTKCLIYILYFSDSSIL